MKPELRSLYIYLTDECNLSCIHCWQSAPLSATGKYSRLKYDDCRRFLADTVAMGLKGITFSGGEPLLNPEFPRFADFFYQNQVHMAMETNGILISKENILETVKNFGVYCAISLDGVNAGTHNRQRGNNGAFKKTIRGLKRLEEAGITFQVIMSISRLNFPELIPLMDWVKKELKHCDRFKINIVNNLGRGEALARDGQLFNAEELPGIGEELAGLVDRYPFQIALHIDPVFISFSNFKLKYTCGGNCGYASSLSILANGRVSICSLGKQVDKYIFGHVATIDVKDVWENYPLLKEIHDQVHTRLKGICANCIFRRQCLGSCRALALCVYGDFFAPHPQCQQYFDSGKFPQNRLINAVIGKDPRIDETRR